MGSGPGKTLRGNRARVFELVLVVRGTVSIPLKGN